ncbi:MAG: toll/interleukin-1 receptor domain-containing protein [Oscillospiraceae bacterium]|nr:toll/interleukin-1 receptor domain-containing protein [Oscillospiraceae bacterium]
MNAYTGKEPYAFFSYAHADRDVVEKIVIGLKQNMCRIWYDEGLTPGESWNDDLAEHLKNSEIVVIMLTKNSVTSQYVKAEINYAISKQIKLLPVFLEQIDLPAGLEMMLSSVQYAILYGESDINRQIRMIQSNLPNTVFATKKVPFFENSEFSFFMEKDSVVNGAASSDKHADAFSILCKNNHNGETKKLFEFCGTKAYDIDYTVTQCKTVDDDYFVGSIQGIHIFNVLAKCELEYPLRGPDFSFLLIFALRMPKDGFPTVRLIDYQYIHITQSKSLEGKRIDESPWGRAIDEECKRKLRVVCDE